MIETFELCALSATTRSICDSKCGFKVSKLIATHPVKPFRYISWKYM